MNPAFEDELVTLYHGDCLEVLRQLPADSIDALVTDPPAGIGFMGKEWDDFRRSRNPADVGRDNVFGRTSAHGPEYGRGRGSDKTQPGPGRWVGQHTTAKTTHHERDAFCDFITAIATECLRVLKPGAHGLVWAIPRTSHWTATALEDAGFEIRDVITHHFGSGFPKSLDVSKAIDKAAGAERQVVGSKLGRPGYSLSAEPGRGVAMEGNVDGSLRDPVAESQITAPATDDAVKWSGWGTALKPASEHWILVRKPLSEPNVAANVLKHGTGAINIDASRISTGDEPNPSLARAAAGYSEAAKKALGSGHASEQGMKGEVVLSSGTSLGRWPANLILSHSPDCKQVGTRKVKSGTAQEPVPKPMERKVYGATNTLGRDVTFADPDGTETIEAWECVKGCPVAELDRQSGTLKSGMMAAGQQRQDSQGGGGYMGGFPDLATAHDTYGDMGGASRFFYTAKADRSERNAGLEGLEERPLRPDRGNPGHLDSLEPKGPRMARNFHPTVKPIDLMRYLIKMITPPNGVVLDCFAGSGSTGVAAKLEGFHCVLVEKESDYVEIIKRRLGWAVHEPELFM